MVHQSAPDRGKEEFFMEKYITDERTGLKYELVGDYYLIAGDDELWEEQKPIGIWGKRHHEFIGRNKRIILSSLQISDKLNSILPILTVRLRKCSSYW